MLLGELIEKLQQIKEKEGDIKCVVSESDEYWGSVENEINDYNMVVKNAQPKGPKSGESEKCLVFSYT